MTMPDTSISDERVHNSVLAGDDRVQQPGTLIRDPRSFPQEIEREQRQQNQPVRQMPATKYAVTRFFVDNKRTYQLLPQDLQRKVAHIKILLAQANGVLLGPDPVVQDAIHGYPLQNGDPELLFTGGSPMFAIGTSATAVQVDVLVEMFDGVQTVN